MRGTVGPLPDSALRSVKAELGSEVAIGDPDASGRSPIRSPDGATVGYVVQTAPVGDRFLGFSGPTNLLLIFDADERILKTEVLSSRDTRDHVALIVKDSSFFDGWKGLSKAEAAQRMGIKYVAGATLTSMAMTQAIQSRLGANAIIGKFPEPLTIEDAKVFFKQAAFLKQDATTPSIWSVSDEAGRECGRILRTSPAADEIVGYQGPTDARIAISLDGRILGLSVGKSFDNEPYVGYVRKDRSFEALLKKYLINDLPKIDTAEQGIEGVSGATMTSMALVEGLRKAAAEYQQALTEQESRWKRWKESLQRAAGTLVVVVIGCLLGLNRFRGRRGFRAVFQGVVLIYLGFINGELLSVAMFAGWAQSGIPWRNAMGLIILSIAALVLPVVAKSNVYCSHLCPHGVAQQLLPRRWKLSGPITGGWRTCLMMIRPILIVWIVVVLCYPLAFSLVDLEAFDAYAWRAAAWPSIAIAVGGLIFSLFVPMGYCRYGCVTGSLLQYIRRHAKSDRFQKADCFALGCLGLAAVLYFNVFSLLF